MASSAAFVSAATFSCSSVASFSSSSFTRASAASAAGLSVLDGGAAGTTGSGRRSRNHPARTAAITANPPRPMKSGPRRGLASSLWNVKPDAASWAETAGLLGG